MPLKQGEGTHKSYVESSDDDNDISYGPNDEPDDAEGDPESCINVAELVSGVVSRPKRRLSLGDDGDDSMDSDIEELPKGPSGQKPGGISAPKAPMGKKAPLGRQMTKPKAPPAAAPAKMPPVPTPYSPFTGIANNPGDNYCYLNALLQLLFNMRQLRSGLMSVAEGRRKALVEASIKEEKKDESEDATTTEQGNAINVITSTYDDYSDQRDVWQQHPTHMPPKISISACRELLSKLDRRYQRGDMNDPSEAIYAVMSELHRNVVPISNQRDSTGGNDEDPTCSCLVHRGLSVVHDHRWRCRRAGCKAKGKLQCDRFPAFATSAAVWPLLYKDGEDGKPESRFQVVHLIKTPSDGDDAPPPPPASRFVDLVRWTFANGAETRNCEGCGEPCGIAPRVLRYPNQHIVVHFNWHTTRPPVSDVVDLCTHVFEETFALQSVFPTVEDIRDQNQGTDGRQVDDIPNFSSDTTATSSDEETSAVSRKGNGKSAVDDNVLAASVTSIVVFRGEHYFAFLFEADDDTVAATSKASKSPSRKPSPKRGRSTSPKRQPAKTAERKGKWWMVNDDKPQVFVGTRWVDVLAAMIVYRCAPILLGCDVRLLPAHILNNLPRVSEEELNEARTKVQETITASQKLQEQVRLVSQRQKREALKKQAEANGSKNQPTLDAFLVPGKKPPLKDDADVALLGDLLRDGVVASVHNSNGSERKSTGLEAIQAVYMKLVSELQPAVPEGTDERTLIHALEKHKLNVEHAANAIFEGAKPKFNWKLPWERKQVANVADHIEIPDSPTTVDCDGDEALARQLQEEEEEHNRSRQQQNTPRVVSANTPISDLARTLLPEEKSALERDERAARRETGRQLFLPVTRSSYGGNSGKWQSRSDTIISNAGGKNRSKQQHDDALETQPLMGHVGCVLMPRRSDEHHRVTTLAKSLGMQIRAAKDSRGAAVFHFITTKDYLVAAMLNSEESKKAQKDVRSFGSIDDDLLRALRQKFHQFIHPDFLQQVQQQNQPVETASFQLARRDLGLKKTVEDYVNRQDAQRPQNREFLGGYTLMQKGQSTRKGQTEIPPTQQDEDDIFHEERSPTPKRGRGRGRPKSTKKKSGKVSSVEAVDSDDTEEYTTVPVDAKSNSKSKSRKDSRKRPRDDEEEVELVVE